MSADFLDLAAHSSGDLLLDRRYRWAAASLVQGDGRTAIDLFDLVLEAAAGWAAAWFVLGEAQEPIGDRLECA